MYTECFTLQQWVPPLLASLSMKDIENKSKMKGQVRKHKEKYPKKMTG